MKNILDTIQAFVAVVGGYIGLYLGGFDGFVYTLIIFVVTDYLTGVFIAICEKKVSSSVGFRGIFRKVLIFTLVGIGSVIDTHLIKTGSAIRTSIVFFYVANEGISILENISKLGLPIPNKLKNVLEQINKKEAK